MGSLLTILALCSSVAGFSLGEIPSQTAGYGEAFTGMLPSPTAAPRLDLVRKRMEKRSATNVCTEWTIPGGYGQPECSNSETCLFTTADDGFYYEACARTDSSYNWATECWDYPQTGVAPVSQTYCDEDQPYCGFLAFVFAPDSTFINWGCDTASYGLTVELLDTDDVATASSDTALILTGGATITQATTSPKQTSTTKPTGLSTQNPGSTTAAKKQKKKTPIAPIVGGVVGGVVFLALVALLAWFLIRKNKTSKNPAVYPVGNKQEGIHAGSAQQGGVYVAPVAASVSTPQQKEPEKQIQVMETKEVYHPPAASNSVVSAVAGVQRQKRRVQQEQQQQQQEIYRPPPEFVLDMRGGGSRDGSGDGDGDDSESLVVEE